MFGSSCYKISLTLKIKKGTHLRSRTYVRKFSCGKRSPETWYNWLSARNSLFFSAILCPQSSQAHQITLSRLPNTLTPPLQTLELVLSFLRWRIPRSSSRTRFGFCFRVWTKITAIRFSTSCARYEFFNRKFIVNYNQECFTTLKYIYIFLGCFIILFSLMGLGFLIFGCPFGEIRLINTIWGGLTSSNSYVCVAWVVV